jgi:hypothetical protein
MDFGFGFGDLIAVGTLCLKVYQRYKSSLGNYRELSSEVGALHNVIKESKGISSQQRLNAEQKARLALSKVGCEEVLAELGNLLVKYKILGTEELGKINRVGFAMQDLDTVRLRSISNVSMLDAFNNTEVDPLEDCDGRHSSLILLAPLMLGSKASLME